MGFFDVKATGNGGTSIGDTLKGLIDKVQETAATDTIYTWFKKNWFWFVLPVGLVLVFVIIKKLIKKK